MKGWFAFFSRPVFIWVSLLTLIVSLFSYGWFFSQRHSVEKFPHSLSNSLEIQFLDNTISRNDLQYLQEKVPEGIVLRSETLQDSFLHSEAIYEPLETLYWISDYSTFTDKYPTFDSIGFIPELNEIKNIEKGISLPILNGSQEKGIQSYDFEAKIVSQPEYLLSGTTGSIEVLLKNTGVVPWKSSDVYLITQKPYRYKSIFYDNSSWLGQGVVRGIPRDISPNEEVRMSFSIKAPKETGLYRDFSFGFGLKRSETWLPIPGDPMTLNLYVLDETPISGNFLQDFSNLYGKYQDLNDSKKLISSVFASSESFSNSEIRTQLQPILDEMKFQYEFLSPHSTLPGLPWLWIVIGFIAILGVIFLSMPQLSFFLFETTVLLISIGFFLFTTFFFDDLANEVSFVLFIITVFSLIISHVFLFRVFFTSIQNKQLLFTVFTRLWKKVFMFLFFCSLTLGAILISTNLESFLLFLIPVWISCIFYPLWFHLYLLVVGEHSRIFHITFPRIRLPKFSQWVKGGILILSILSFILLIIFLPRNFKLNFSQYSLAEIHFPTTESLNSIPAISFENLSQEDSNSVYEELYKKPYIRSIDSLVGILPVRQNEKIPIIKALKEATSKNIFISASFEDKMKQSQKTCLLYKQFPTHPYFEWCSKLQGFLEKIGTQSFSDISLELSNKAITVFKNIQSSAIDRPLSYESIPKDTLQKFQNTSGNQTMYVFLNSLVNTSIPIQSVLHDIQNLSNSWQFLDFTTDQFSILFIYLLLFGFSFIFFLISKNYRLNYVLHYSTYSFLTITLFTSLFYFFNSIQLVVFYFALCVITGVHFYLSLSSKAFISYGEVSALKKEELETFLKSSSENKETQKEEPKMVEKISKSPIENNITQSFGGYTSQHNEDWYHFVFQIPVDLNLDQIEVFVTDQLLSVSFPHKSKLVQVDIDLDEAVDTAKIQCKIQNEELHILLPKITPSSSQPHQEAIEIEDYEVESVIQPVEIFERDLPIQISVDDSNVYISIPLEGISKKHLDIEADELHLFIQSKNTTLMHFKKEVVLPYPIMVDEIISDSSEQMLKLICPRKHHIQKVEIMDE